MADFKLQPQLNHAQQQNQIKKLALTQQFQQSLQILQANTLTLHQLVSAKCLANPFVNFLAEPLGQISTANKTANSELYLPKQNSKTLSEHLDEQIRLLMRPTKLRKWVEFLVDNLDDNGYLPKKKLAEWNQLARKDDVYLADAIALLQNLDPPGIGAIDLAECLGLQMQHTPATPPLAYLLCTNDLAALADRKWDQLASKYHVSIKTVAATFRFIQTLSPAPGAAFVSDVNGAVLPDAVVDCKDGVVTFTLTKATAPHVRFDLASYERMLLKANAAERTYIMEQKISFEQLKADLTHRQTTLEKITAAICERQRFFFESRGKQLVPWLLRQLASDLKLHESTVSRAISGKFLQTDFGVFSYKHFFVRAISVSAAEQKTLQDLNEKLKELIIAEDKNQPLSDQQLADTLGRLGWQLSRRTVAKYRNRLGILTAAARKRTAKWEE